MTDQRTSPTWLAGVLHEAAAAVADALVDTADWGEAGTRAGQHHSDLAADAAAVMVLRAAGLGVLSEESGRQGNDQQGSDAAVTVVLDPLDGSTNASRGLSWWIAGRPSGSCWPRRDRRGS